MADQLHGLTLAFNSSFLTEVTNLGHTGISRSAIETSSNDTTTWMTFRPSDLINPGQLEIQGYFDHDKNIATPLTSTAETITVTFALDTGETTAANWTASGFLTEFSYEGGTVDDPAATYSATLKLSGAVTVTASQA